VPVVSHDLVLGNLYLSEKQDAKTFDPADEETLARFATLAALAIENARLHRRVKALAVTEERERIAREMHDSLAQVLGYVNTKAQAAEVLIEHGEMERASAQLGQLASAARAAYADVREGILGLRTSLGEDRGFVATLRDYLESWQGQSGVAVELVFAPAPFEPELTPTGEVQLLRIIQEALANVRKHAGAKRARVSMSRDRDGLQVIIADDGAGFAADAMRRTETPRFGLATMRERAEAVGGSLEIVSKPGEGAEVIVRLPATAPTRTRRETAHAHPHR
jgi:signal transduction histidine kinase